VVEVASLENSHEMAVCVAIVVGAVIRPKFALFAAESAPGLTALGAVDQFIDQWLVLLVVD